jgi:hypothetical protein
VSDNVTGPQTIRSLAEKLASCIGGELEPCEAERCVSAPLLDELFHGLGRAVAVRGT